MDFLPWSSGQKTAMTGVAMGVWVEPWVAARQDAPVCACRSARGGGLRARHVHEWDCVQARARRRSTYEPMACSGRRQRMQ
eukprot:CAMPEP_0174365164 /NCGR_PEP_ID=MMETSP0811_2-20130205/76137_1 /TAXON_ID=73025 ORGANISM="Eutreptiella gymnastica-like, Strain CCMP1594" /NCGR_SAMPLE_ID=MMETSP0811_2 /ASSEMBLY_ACC=CAM_ASM_000667 /LENGTH=80 /DNA_ID=CAMNT_0015505563 /DNA_START=275 /DNA_END=517 /DNA_ORIENTATION=+